MNPKACHPPTEDSLADILAGLAALLRKKQKPHFEYEIEVSDKHQTTMPLKLKINDEQKVKVTLTPVTPRGKPVKVDGVPSWTTIDGDSTIVVAEDGMSADLISSDTPGVTNFQVAADADLGEGVDTITDTIELTVVDPQASSLGLSAGTPEDKAPA